MLANGMGEAVKVRQAVLRQESKRVENMKLIPVFPSQKRRVGFGVPSPLKYLGYVFVALLALNFSWWAYDQVFLKAWNFKLLFPINVRLKMWNHSNDNLLIESIVFGDKEKGVTTKIERLLAVDRPRKPKWSVSDLQFAFNFPAQRYRQQLEVWYRPLFSGKEKHATFLLDLRPRARCQFTLGFFESGPRLTKCLRSDFEDFD